MSRSGYVEDCDEGWQFALYRGRVVRALRGKRGQAFLKEMLTAMDALPEKKLIADDLETEDGAVCAIGAVGKARGITMTEWDPEDAERVAAAFGIAPSMAREIVYTNDEDFSNCSPEERFALMRRWIEREIIKESGQPSHKGMETP